MLIGTLYWYMFSMGDGVAYPHRHEDVVNTSTAQDAATTAAGVSDDAQVTWQNGETRINVPEEMAKLTVVKPAEANV